MLDGIAIFLCLGTGGGIFLLAGLLAASCGVNSSIEINDRNGWHVHICTVVDS